MARDVKKQDIKEHQIHDEKLNSRGANSKVEEAPKAKAADSVVKSSVDDYIYHDHNEVSPAPVHQAENAPSGPSQEYIDTHSFRANNGETRFTKPNARLYQQSNPTRNARAEYEGNYRYSQNDYQAQNIPSQEYSQSARRVQQESDTFSLRSDAERLSLSENRSFLNERGYNVDNYSNAELSNAASSGKLRGRQLSYDEQQAFKGYSEELQRFGESTRSNFSQDGLREIKSQNLSEQESSFGRSATRSPSRNARAQYHGRYQRNDNLFQEAPSQSSYQSTQRASIQQHKRDDFSLRTNAERLQYSEQRDYFSSKGFNVANYSVDQVRSAANSGKLNGKQLSYDEQQAFKEYGEQLNRFGANQGSNRIHESDIGTMSSRDIKTGDIPTSEQPGSGLSRRGRITGQGVGDVSDTQGTITPNEARPSHIVERQIDTRTRIVNEPGAISDRIIDPQSASTSHIVDPSQKGPQVYHQNADLNYNAIGQRGSATRSPRLGNRNRGETIESNHTQQTASRQNGLAVNNEPVAPSAPTQEVHTSREIHSIRNENREITHQTTGRDITHLQEKDVKGVVSHQTSGTSPSSASQQSAQAASHKRLVLRNGKISQEPQVTVSQAPTSGTEAYYNQKDLTHTRIIKTQDGFKAESVNKPSNNTSDFARKLESNMSMSGTRKAETNVFSQNRSGDIKSLKPEASIDPTKKMNPRSRDLSERQYTDKRTLKIADENMSSGKSPLRSQKLRVRSHEGIEDGLPGKESVTSTTGKMGDKETARKIWMKNQAKQQQQARAERNLTFGGSGSPLSNIGTKLSNAFTRFGSKAVAIGVAGSVAVGGLVGVATPVVDSIALKPQASLYYMDGSAQSDAEAIEKKTNIFKNVYRWLTGKEESESEDAKVVITQAAVDKMKEWQDTYEESMYPSVENNTTYTYLGTLTDGSGVVIEKPTAPDSFDYYSFNPMSGKHTNLWSNRQKSTFKVIYHDDVYGMSSTSQSIYTYGVSYLDIRQTLGNSNFADRSEDEYIIGWSLTPGSSVTDFGTYAKLDTTYVWDHPEYYENFKRLYNAASGGVVHLYAVWKPPLTVDWTAGEKNDYEVRLATMEEASSEELGKFFYGGKPITVSFVYTDKENGRTYTIDGDDVPIYYSQTELYKTILAMAVVATNNDYKHPEAFVNYCLERLQSVMMNPIDVKITTTVVTLTGTAGTEYGVTKEIDGNTYSADGARLRASVRIMVDANPYDLIENDPTQASDIYAKNPFPGWEEQGSIDWVMAYLELDTSDFLELFQVSMPALTTYMNAMNSRYPNAAYVYNVLIGHGFSREAALGVLGNLAQESTIYINPTQLNEFGYAGIMQTPISRLNKYAAKYGEQWPNISVATQTLAMLEMLEGSEIAPADWSGNESALFPDVDFNMTLAQFKQIDDIDKATILFMVKFERPGNYAEEAPKRINFAHIYEEDILFGFDGGTDYLTWAIQIANNDTYGYGSWGTSDDNGEGFFTHPDQCNFDCATFVFCSLYATGWPVDLQYKHSHATSYAEAVGFIKIPFVDESQLLPGDIIVRLTNNDIGGNHAEIYVGNGFATVGAHSDRGHPEYGDQDGTEISVLEAWPSEWVGGYWEWILRPPAGSFVETENEGRGKLTGLTKVSFFSKTSEYEGYTKGKCDTVYNGGNVAYGMASSTSDDLPLGTIIYVETVATGNGSAANGRYYIITGKWGPSDGTVMLYHDVASSNDELQRAPCGSYTQSKIYVVKQNCKWSTYRADWENKKWAKQ